jgi:hypothetical protein
VVTPVRLTARFMATDDQPMAAFGALDGGEEEIR